MAPVSPPAPARRRRTGVVVTLTAAALVGAVAITAAVVTPLRSSARLTAGSGSAPATPSGGATGTPAPSPTGTPPARHGVVRATGTMPSQLRTSLAGALPGMQAFVEHVRGHRYTSNVPVRFLTDKQFVDRFLSGTGDGADDGTGSTYTSLGLVGSAGDYSKQQSDDARKSVVGLYSRRSRALYVRGTVLTPDARVVLVHELTHALDDQVHGFTVTHAASYDADAELALTSVIEGDAVYVEDRYIATLPPGQRCFLEMSFVRPLESFCVRDGFIDPSEWSPRSAPSAVVTQAEFPYTEGPKFVAALVKHGGMAAVDQALYPMVPDSTDQIVHPSAYFDGDKPAYVDTPLTPVDETNHGVLGVFGLTLLLDNGRPPGSEGYLTGWRGDRYATYQNHGKTCTTADVLMSSRTSASQLVGRLRDWGSRVGGVSVRRAGAAEVEFTSCR